MTLNNRVAVLGGGTMGPGIAVTYALGGYDTTVYSRTKATLENAEAVCRNSLELFCQQNRITQEEADLALARITYTDSLSTAVDGAWYIAETIVEKPVIYVSNDAFRIEPTLVMPAVAAPMLLVFLIHLMVKYREPPKKKEGESNHGS